MTTILIAGGSGLIGKRLTLLLKQRGYEVNWLSRSPEKEIEIKTFGWDPAKATIDPAALQKADYIINLAGSGIADKRWTEARKKDIIDSRVQSGDLFLKSFSENRGTVKAYISASAIGFYGDRGNDLMTEISAPGTGFLSIRTIEWEKPPLKIAATGLRTVRIRIGIVLAAKGGALPQLKFPFNFRTGVYFSDGQAWYSWIHIDDLCHIFIKAIEDDQMNGVYDAVSPEPVTGKEMIKNIGKALGGFYLYLSMPSFLLRLFMGEMADVVLNSTKVSAQKIRDAGFAFQFPNVLDALKNIYNPVKTNG